MVAQQVNTTDLDKFMLDVIAKEAKTTSTEFFKIKVNVVFLNEDKPTVMLFLQDKYKTNIKIDYGIELDILFNVKQIKKQYHVGFSSQLKFEYISDGEHIYCYVYKDGKKLN
jgi:hypothetical protein